LNNFTLQVGNASPVNFGACTANPATNDFASDVAHSSNNDLKFLTALFNAYTTSKSKSTTLKVSFTSNENITGNVNLIITINGEYNWNVYDK
jgi:hypothetical protein